MRKGFRELKRKLGRVVEEFNASKEISSFTSIIEGFEVFRAKFDIQVMCRNGFKEPPAVKARLLRKHDITMRYLEKKYAYYWDSYTFPVKTGNANTVNSGKIWVCWWQGIENAPEIVRKCIDSIKRNAGGREVVVITDRNVSDYVKFPDHIEKKVREGVISRTIYSDLLRLNLLATYGGVWLDSTFLASGDISRYLDLPLWSIKRTNYLHASVAGGRFANYSLGCGVQNRWIFKAVFDFLCHYWEVNDRLVDYLLTDYVIVMVANHCPEMAAEMAAIEPNNQQCDELAKILNEPYDSRTWNNLIKNTDLFKLSWKQEFVREASGKPTFYGKLVDGELA